MTTQVVAPLRRVEFVWLVGPPMPDEAPTDPTYLISRRPKSLLPFHPDAVELWTTAQPIRDFAHEIASSVASE